MNCDVEFEHALCVGFDFYIFYFIDVILCDLNLLISSGKKTSTFLLLYDRDDHIINGVTCLVAMICKLSIREHDTLDNPIILGYLIWIRSFV